MSNASKIVLLIVVLLAAAVGYWYWTSQAAGQGAAPETPTEAAEATPAQTPPSAPDAASAAEPAIRYPIASEPEAAASVATLEAPPAPAPSLTDRLSGVLGRQAMLTFVHSDNFVTHTVATIDNLGRERAPSRVWPVAPAGGQFSVSETAGGPTVIADANAERYQGFVDFLSGVDTAAVVDLYATDYPRFQAAYEELGFPGQYFNDRLIDVIDLLLATPEPTSPPAVTLTEVQGPYTLQRPWTHYEFADPALEKLPSGQKMLLRMNAAQRAQVKSKLQELKAAILARTSPR